MKIASHWLGGVVLAFAFGGCGAGEAGSAGDTAHADSSDPNANDDDSNDDPDGGDSDGNDSNDDGPGGEKSCRTALDCDHEGGERCRMDAISIRMNMFP